MKLKLDATDWAGVFLYKKIKVMEEIILQCVESKNDKMIVSIGTNICFEVIENDTSKTVCINTKDAAKLIHYLSIYLFNEL
jgi:hypothetical protein